MKSIVLGAPRVFKATLPLPVSVNDLHTPRRGGGVMLTSAARLYYQKMAAILPGLWPHAPWQTERLRLTYTLHESDLRRRDVSNYVKALQDGLEGFVYANDSQLDEVVCLRGELRGTPEVYVEVSVIEQPLVREPLKKAKADRDKADADFASKQAKNKAMRMAGLKVFDTLCLPHKPPQKKEKNK